MANKEEGVENFPREADWEVVSLTASAYAAAPGPNMLKGEQKSDDVIDKNKGDTSNALFMSGHFVFPRSQHDNLPLQGEEDYSEPVKEEGGKSHAKDEDNWNIGKLTDSDDFHGIPFFDEKAFAGFNLASKEPSLYGSAKFHSLHNEAASNIDDEDSVLVRSLESSDPTLDSNIPNLSKHLEEENYNGSGLPYAAWLKKQASCLYAHAKETNTFWSIFIASAVMGLVIVGQQWQQERWQVLHHKWQFGINDEITRRMLDPISRFKDAILGGNRRGFSIRSNASGER